MELQLPSLSSRDVDHFLLGFHNVSADERDGYIQRLRSITRLGFPAGLSVGKGHPARYDANQFFQFLSVTELYRCNVPPLQAVRFVDVSWPAMKASILTVWDSVDAGEHGRLLEVPRKFWRVPAEGGQRQTRVPGASEPHPAERIVVMSRSEVDALIDGNDLLDHCYSLIDVSKLIGGVFNHLKWSGNPMTAEQIACFMTGMSHGK
jgi:hypothetical protein